jgi:hypothetical protein
MLGHEERWPAWSLAGQGRHPLLDLRVLRSPGLGTARYGRA